MRAQAVRATISLSLTRAVNAFIAPDFLWRGQCRRSAAEPERNPGRDLYSNREGDFGFYNGGNLPYVGRAVKGANCLARTTCCATAMPMPADLSYLTTA
jgi:hypothetical protein